MPRLPLLIVSIVVLAGCNERNPEFCNNPDHADNPICNDAGNGGSCQSNADCADTPNFPVCDTMASPHTCVQCTESDPTHCTGTTPVCKSDTCAACTLDNDCGTGGLCLPDGACAASDHIIHAASNGSNMTTCDDTSSPCNLTKALTVVTSVKNVIKLDDAGPYTPDANSFVVSIDVTIDARGATLHHNGNNPILSINNSKTARIFGGTIEGATGDMGDGILCGPSASLTVDGTTIQMIDKSAINATSGCKLTIVNATIRNSSLRSGVSVAAILDNGDSVTLSRSQVLSTKGGGINVGGGKFVIVGNIFWGNGNTTSANGAVLINTNSDPMNRLEFNSISGNLAMTGANAPGVHCNAGTDFIARNNIIWGNNLNAGVQIGGSCKHAYSDIGMLSVGGLNDGGNNLSVDPMFISSSDLHLMPTSTLLKKADPASQLDGIAAKDIDGDPRVAPADIGADQLRRP
jgi:hypothetical protein